MNVIKRICISAVVVVSAASFLTACHTVKGTVWGAERDVKNVEKAVGIKHHKHKKHHRHHAKNHMQKKEMMSENQ